MPPHGGGRDLNGLALVPGRRGRVPGAEDSEASGEPWSGLCHRSPAPPVCHAPSGQNLASSSPGGRLRISLVLASFCPSSLPAPLCGVICSICCSPCCIVELAHLSLCWLPIHLSCHWGSVTDALALRLQGQNRTEILFKGTPK